MKRSRLSRKGTKARPVRMKSIKKFDSYYMLNSHMSGIGMSHILNDIEELEMKAEQRHGKKVSRDKVQNRLLEWWNDETLPEPDIGFHRPSYIMMALLKKKVMERGE